MNIVEWLESNSLVVLAMLFVFYIIAWNKFPSVNTWQNFVDSFETQGGLLILLWFTDLIFLLILIFLWKRIDTTLQTTIVGLVSGVNGAFLGAARARAGVNGNGSTPITPVSDSSAAPANGASPPPSPTTHP